MYRYIKRILDIILAFLLIILLLPLEVIVGLTCKIITGKAFYKQKRDGLNKKSYMLYKFSSIRPDSKYSKVLNFIRCFGLDELPQMVNILKGEMSFIGPRPFITGEHLPKKPDKLIYTIRPGLMSLATAKGRRMISHEKRLEYDIYYAKNMSLRLDLYIIFKTICVLFKQNLKGDLDGQII